MFRISLQATKFHISKSRTSLQAYFDFKFRLSQSRTTLQAYFDFNFTFHRQENSLEDLDLEFHISSQELV